jgi:hypothetical protein
MACDRATLEPDLRYWEQKARDRHRPLRVSDVVGQARGLLWSPYVGLMIVRQGVASFYTAWTVEDFAHNRMTRMRDALMQLQADDRGVSLPDTMLIFNSEDTPICHRVKGCKASRALCVLALSDQAGRTYPCDDS